LDQFAVAKQIEIAAVKYNATLLVTTGDNFYEAGVENDTDPKWQTVWRDVYNTPKLSKMPWWVTLGNHDRYAKTRGQGQIDYYTKGHDARWYLPNPWYTKTLQLANAVSTPSLDRLFTFVASVTLVNGMIGW
jgi:tartrate-resistant acid phosphatase type 5